MRRWGWAFAIGFAVVIVLMAGAVVGTRTGRYVAGAARAEAGILRRRRPIAEVMEDAAVDARTKAMLGLVLAVRRFAAESLSLDVGHSYLTYSTVPSDTLVMVLTGARRDKLVRVTWWYPIIGRVPYQGFFDRGDAERERARLALLGLDVELRPAAAFSTLGWFDDALMSPTLAGDSAGVAETVLHELLHNTYFVPGDVAFNESLANFVGHRGAQAFFSLRRDSANAVTVRDRWRDEIQLGAFWTRYGVQLDSAFRQHPADSFARLAARETLEARARVNLRDAVAPRLLVPRPAGWADEVALGNNAVLSKSLYRTGLHGFDAALFVSKGDIRTAIRRIIEVDKKGREAR